MESKYQSGRFHHLLNWFTFSRFREHLAKKHVLESKNKISKPKAIPDRKKVDLRFILKNIEPE